MEKKLEILLFEEINSLEGEKKNIIETFNQQIYKKQKELEDICTHSQTELIVQNYEGGYLNVAEYNKITKCKLCKKELKRITITGGYA